MAAKTTKKATTAKAPKTTKATKAAKSARKSKTQKSIVAQPSARRLFADRLDYLTNGRTVFTDRIRRPALPRVRAMRRPAAAAPAVDYQALYQASQEKAGGLWQSLRRSWSGSLLPFVSVALVIATILTLHGAPKFGAFLTVATVGFLLYISSWRDALRPFGLALVIFPVALMVALTLPMQNDYSLTILFYGLITLLALVYHYLFTMPAPLPRSHLTRYQYLVLLPLMLVVGEAMGAAAYFIFGVDRPFAGVNLGVVAAALALFGVIEEIYFRGLVQHCTQLLGRPIVAAILTAALYGVAVLSFLSVGASIFGFIFGAAMSAVYYYKPNVLLPMTANIASKLTFIGFIALFAVR